METIRVCSSRNGVAMVVVKLESDAAVEVNYENRDANSYKQAMCKHFKPGEQLIQFNYGPYVGKGYRMWLFISDSVVSPSRGCWSEMIDDLDKIEVGTIILPEEPNGF